MRKTVCIDCRYLSDRPSGIGEVVQALVDYVPSLAPDLNFKLLRNPRRTARLSEAPNVVEVPVSQAANGPATMWWLGRVVDMTDVAVFHAPSNIMPAGLSVPCVTTIHDMMWLTDPAQCRIGKRGYIDQQFYGHGMRRALRRADAIATVSEATAQAVAAHSPGAARRVHVTRSGVGAQFRRSDAAHRLLEPLGLGPGTPFVLTVGQNAPYKNHEGALRAFARAFPDGPVQHVFVQRRGWGSTQLEILARELGVESRVKFLQVVPFELLLALYSSARALLHPSFCEGFGNPVAEAMACGCPVITSARSAMAEVAGDAAVLVDPEDGAGLAAALQSVLANEQLAASMKHRGLERAAQLSWRSFAEANLHIYRKVLEE